MKTEFELSPRNLAKIAVISTAAVVLCPLKLLVITAIALATLATAIYFLSASSSSSVPSTAPIPCPTPKFKTKRPPPLSLSLKSPLRPVEVFVTPRSSPRSPLTGLLLTPRSSPLSPDDELFLTPNPRSPSSPRPVAPPTIPPFEQQRANALAVPPIPDYPVDPLKDQGIEDYLLDFIGFVASLPEADLNSPDTQKKIEKEIKDFSRWFNPHEILSTIRSLYKGNPTCRAHIDQILGNPKIFALMDEPFRHLSRYFHTSQADIFAIIEEENYEQLIDLFLQVLNQSTVSKQISIEKDPDKTVKQRLAELIEFLATTWTASFVFPTTRTELSKRLDALETAAPLDCLRELQRLYQDRTSPTRKHLQLLLKPSRWKNPECFLKKEFVLRVAKIGQALAGKAIGIPVETICSLLGQKKYKELIQRFLLLEPIEQVAQAKRFIDANCVDPNLSVL